MLKFLSSRSVAYPSPHSQLPRSPSLHLASDLTHLTHFVRQADEAQYEYILLSLSAELLRT